MAPVSMTPIQKSLLIELAFSRDTIAAYPDAAISVVGSSQPDTVIVVNVRSVASAIAIESDFAPSNAMVGPIVPAT